MGRKIFILCLIIVFLISYLTPSYASGLVIDFLYEMGLKFYHQGRYLDALKEFQKALILDPNYEPALKYLEMLKEKLAPKPVIPEVSPVKERQKIIKELLDKIERERVVPPVTAPPEPKAIIPKKIPIKEELMPRFLLGQPIIQPLKIEKGKSIIIQGKGIKRFLSISPEALTIEKISPDEILVTAKELGYTYLHIWDEQGRQTLELLSVPPKPEGPTYEELMRREEERARNFKLHYSLDWYSYESGRRIYDLERSTYAYSHWIGLTGETPYGDFDTGAAIQRWRRESDITYFTLGLEEAKYGPFKDFSLRFFNYTSDIENLILPAFGLRGVRLKSPAFDKKLNYNLFWGRECESRYAGISPEIKTRDAFLGGLDLNFSPGERQNYDFSIIHGWGRDRAKDLNPYGYDLKTSYNFDKFNIGYEVAFDSESFAHLLNTIFTLPRLKLTSEFRDISKDFRTMIGWGWRPGERGILNTVSYTLSEKVFTSARLDLFQDRLYPNPEDEDRFNQNLSWDLNYTLSPLTGIRLDYNLQNELGRISPLRSHIAGLGLSHRFDWIRKFDTYLNFKHSETKSFSSPSMDYINEKISLGFRFNLIDDLYYFLNKEFNWTEARYSGEKALPQSMETGLDWYGRIYKSPFYGNFRLLYRDEEDTVSTFSFLSGEDYLEGYGEISYRPTSDKELYISSRIRNVWADNPNVRKRTEADFRAGMRYLWDTGIRWESIGEIEGFCFKDLNSDGIMQSDEKPLEGIKLWLGKDRFSITDNRGYYRFPRVKARKAYVNIDPTSIPLGFVLTVPATQQATIAHGKKVRLDFGIISRSEIYGFIFEDKDGDGRFSTNDFPIRDVVLLLEDGSKAITDERGRYYFRKVEPGRHTLNLDLNTLPSQYLPTVPILKDIELFEGVSYNYNIPLKRIQN
ncbi:MAG: tetratricopeptide repeat protein [Candidatus Omnitrophica bacterium]|nr:tetratricopeptide repeat protein [Candidatus Omnitrophota bacterium]